MNDFFDHPLEYFFLIASLGLIILVCLIILFIVLYSLGASIKTKSIGRFIGLFVIGLVLFYISGHFSEKFLPPFKLTNFFFTILWVLFFNMGLNTHSHPKDKSSVIFDGLKQGFVAHFLTSVAGAALGSLLGRALTFFVGRLFSPSTLVLIGFFISFITGVALSRLLSRYLESLMTPKVAGAMGGFVGGLLLGLFHAFFFGMVIGMCFCGIVETIFSFSDTSHHHKAVGYLTIFSLLVGAIPGFKWGFHDGFAQGRRVGIKGYGSGEGKVYGGFLLGGFKGGKPFGGFGGAASGGGGSGAGW